MADSKALVAEIEALGATLGQAKASINRRFIGQEKVVDLVLAWERPGWSTRLGRSWA
jgi:MoxR-like ATPase